MSWPGWVTRGAARRVAFVLVLLYVGQAIAGIVAGVIAGFKIAGLY